MVASTIRKPVARRIATDTIAGAGLTLFAAGMAGFGLPRIAWGIVGAIGLVLLVVAGVRWGRERREARGASTSDSAAPRPQTPTVPQFVANLPTGSQYSASAIPPEAPGAPSIVRAEIIPPPFKPLVVTPQHSASHAQLRQAESPVLPPPFVLRMRAWVAAHEGSPAVTLLTAKGSVTFDSATPTVIEGTVHYKGYFEYEHRMSVELLEQPKISPDRAEEIECEFHGRLPWSFQTPDGFTVPRSANGSVTLMDQLQRPHPAQPVEVNFGPVLKTG
jgi:hypothetical protein